jgi:hypothetical protein
MNYGRLVLAAVVATAFDMVYGFVVYGQLLGSEFAKYPAIYRASETQTQYLPLMSIGILFAMLVASYLYARSADGAGGVGAGMRFGVLMGLVMVGYVAGVNYGIMNIGRRLAASYALAGLVEWVIIGIAFGSIYRAAPSVPGQIRPAAAGV